MDTTGLLAGKLESIFNWFFKYIQYNFFGYTPKTFWVYLKLSFFNYTHEGNNFFEYIQNFFLAWWHDSVAWEHDNQHATCTVRPGLTVRPHTVRLTVTHLVFTYVVYEQFVHQNKTELLASDNHTPALNWFVFFEFLQLFVSLTNMARPKNTRSSVKTAKSARFSRNSENRLKKE